MTSMGKVGSMSEIFLHRSKKSSGSVEYSTEGATLQVSTKNSITSTSENLQLLGRTWRIAQSGY